MDLSTTYMGITLKNPFVPSAGPYSENLGTLRQMEDAGASAVVLHSLFEEQIRQDEHQLLHDLEQGSESHPESLSFFPQMSEFRLGPEEYLEHIRKAKASLGIPVIASLNGMTPGGWTGYARKMEQAGADALECNIYFLATDPAETSGAVEQRYVQIARSVKEQVRIPVAVKLSPQFSSIASMARKLDEEGVDGLALFNRFYQPDIDLETLVVTPNLVLSSSWESRMVMRWIAVLFGRIQAGLAATGGAHTHEDAIKLIMSGADVVHLCSTLLLNGPKRLGEICRSMERWMEEHEYESVSQMKGSMSQRNCPNPAAFERANYMKVLHSFA
jgi:dihydroorotate dehydrogenase (fumarate)